MILETRRATNSSVLRDNNDITVAELSCPAAPDFAVDGRGIAVAGSSRKSKQCVKVNCMLKRDNARARFGNPVNDPDQIHRGSVATYGCKEDRMLTFPSIPTWIEADARSERDMNMLQRIKQRPYTDHMQIGVVADTETPRRHIGSGQKYPDGPSTTGGSGRCSAGS